MEKFKVSLAFSIYHLPFSIQAGHFQRPASAVSPAESGDRLRADAIRTARGNA
jgi:hypothetical protein